MHVRSTSVLGVVAGLMAVALAGPAASSPTTSPRRHLEIFDREEECLEAVPAESSVPGVTDDGHDIGLEVHVLLDGVTRAQGLDVMTRAASAYSPQHITMTATFQRVKFPAQLSEPVFVGEPEPTSAEDYLFEKSKDAVGGVPPGDADVVFLLTSDRIRGSQAGVADCIGGIRYPERAFAMGEFFEVSKGAPPVGVTGRWKSATIAAHEIAHLLGAHHHYANCAEGAERALADRHLLTCTLMFPDLAATNLTFSTLEAAVVRGHALEYADDPAPAGDSLLSTS